MSSWLRSLVNHIASRGTVQLPRALQMTAISGGQLWEPFARFDPEQQYWRTSQASFLAMITNEPLQDEFLGSWPRSASIVGMTCYPRPMRAHRIGEAVFGVSRWPTPTASDHKAVSPYGQLSLANHPDIVGTTDRPKMAKSTKGDGLKTTTESQRGRPVLNADFSEWMMNLPRGWTKPEKLLPGAYDEWFNASRGGTWYDDEKGISRTIVGQRDRIARIIALGNGIVPIQFARFLTLDD
jgi:hypothetical protein